MARISGIELKDTFKLDYALTRIRGIGWFRAKEILSDLKFSPATRLSEVTSEQLARITAYLDKYQTEGDLARKVREDIQRLRDIGAYRGVRHTRGLPSRGQRTKSNARTKRGKRKTVGAFKKEALAKMTDKSK